MDSVFGTFCVQLWDLGDRLGDLQVPWLIRVSETAEALCVWLMASQAISVFNSDKNFFLMDVYSDYCYAAGFLLIIRKLATQATGIK